MINILKKSVKSTLVNQKKRFRGQIIAFLQIPNIHYDQPYVFLASHPVGELQDHVPRFQKSQYHKNPIS